MLMFALPKLDSLLHSTLKLSSAGSLRRHLSGSLSSYTIYVSCIVQIVRSASHLWDECKILLNALVGRVNASILVLWITVLITARVGGILLVSYNVLQGLQFGSTYDKYCCNKY